MAPARTLRGRLAALLPAALLLAALSAAPPTPAAVAASGDGPEARVAAALADAVAGRGPWRRDRVRVSEISLPRGFRLKPGERPVVALAARERLPGRVPFRVGRAGGSDTEWASARVEVMVPALVAARTIGRHQVLEPGLLASTEVPLSRLPGGAVTDPDDLVGLRTVRRIPQGRPLARDLVEELPVVLRGDQVTLTVRAPGLTVTAQGEARQDGAPGSVIPVLNLRSHRTVQGRVVDARTVEVAY